MDTYLTYSEASRMTQVSEQVLNQLVLSGKIRSVMMVTGAVLLNSKDVRVQIPLKARPEYSEYSHLAGCKISMSEAARRYGVYQQSISRWVRTGMITRLGSEGRQVLIDEAEVATAAKIYKSSGGSHGRWVFRDGLPYNKKENGE